MIAAMSQTPASLPPAPGFAGLSRRRLLTLGIGSAVLLAVGGGVALSLNAAWADGKLQPPGRAIFAAVLPGVLGELLPTGAPRAAAIAAGVDRVDALIASLPAHSQGELAQLLSLLSTAPGRRGLADLAPDWPEATPAEVQTALQGMRVASLSLKQQAYFALHDASVGAYFSERDTWGLMGYPGPTPIA